MSVDENNMSVAHIDLAISWESDARSSYKAVTCHIPYGFHDSSVEKISEDMHAHRNESLAPPSHEYASNPLRWPPKHTH